MSSYAHQGALAVEFTGENFLCAYYVSIYTCLSSNVSRRRYYGE